MREVNDVQITDEQAELVLMCAVDMVKCGLPHDLDMQTAIAEKLLYCGLVTQEEYDNFAGLN